MDVIYENVNLCITHEIQKEVVYRRYACQSEKIQVLPTKPNQIYKDAKSLGFDEADASMMSILIKKDTYWGVTEDQPLITFGRSFELNIMQLIDFFQFLVKSDILSKNILYKITRDLRKMKNITKKKEKYIKKWLQTTQ